MAYQSTLIDTLTQCARQQGFRTEEFQISPGQLNQQALPTLARVKDGHFVVLEGIADQKVRCWDPAGGPKEYPLAQWSQLGEGSLLAVRPL